MAEVLNWFQAIHWREPLWALLALLPFLAQLLHTRLRRRRLEAYAEPALWPWAFARQGRAASPGRRLRRYALALAWVLFSVALAGPRLAADDRSDPGIPRSDIVLLVDVSRSMQIADTLPNRLRRAQLEIDEFLVHAPGHRVAIVLFAGRAHLYVPLTSDYEALRFYLASLDRLRLPTAGSSPQAAIGMAVELLEKSAPGAAIIMLTDGDWQQGASIDSPYPLFILGIGTEAGGAIPLAEGQWLQKDGVEVISRLNPVLLAETAGRLGGAYSRVESDDSEWQRLYDEGVGRLLPPLPEAAESKPMNWHELYHWALVPGFFLLLLSLAPPLNRRQGAPLAALVLPLLAAGVLMQPTVVRADLRQAYAAYADERYADALDHFRDEKGYEGRLGEGAVHYRLEEYDKAALSFVRAVNLAGSDEQRGAALYNLGNSYFQAGEFAKATTVFEDALLYRPEHPQTQYNLRLSRSVQVAVEELLLRLEQSPEGDDAGAVGEGEPELDPDNLLRSEQASEATTGKAQLPPLPPKQLSALLQKGIAQARLADESAEERAGRLQREIALTDARLRMELLRERQERLWIRLFEMEEGFPGSLDEPAPLPGVDPW